MSDTNHAIESEFAKLADLSLDAFCIAGFDGYLKLVNPAFSRMLGYSEEELLSRPFMEIVHPDDRARVEDAMAALDEGEEVNGFECRQLHADGSLRWVEWNSHARPGEGVVYAVGRDVTEHHRTNDALSALQRLATLVARGAPPEEVFEAAAREVAHVVGTDMVTIDRYEPDGATTVVASVNEPGFPVGSRWPLDGPSLGATVLETARPARIDDYADLQSTSAAAIREQSVSSAAGAPILVDGRPWGIICVAATDALTLPEDVEARLADFTELVATSIARTASREVLRRIAEEQAALRRVATLVAETAAPLAILDAVAEEMKDLLDADQVALNRFEPDAQIVVLAHRGLDVDRTPVGSKMSHEGENVTSIVRRTGSPARMENYDEAGGPLAELARATGLHSSVSAPITVEGEVWGVITASWKGTESPPAETEDRMAKFAHLIDTAIASTEARAVVERLADEQAALRRVATLVAGRVPPEDLFAAVAEEVGLIMSIDATRILRYETDGTATVVARWSEQVDVPPALEIGAQVALEGDTVTSRVYRSGRPARIDKREVTGPLAAVVRGLEVPSGAGAPIVVDGRLWGVMIVGSLVGRPLPPGAEDRLAQFTELVATAIANMDSRAEVERLADEQAALRRVATLVAEGIQPGALFSAVCHEVGAYIGSELVLLAKFDDDGLADTIVGLAREMEGIGIGTRVDFEDWMTATQVYRTGHAARSDGVDWEQLTSPVGRSAANLGIVSTVSAPVTVDGRLWGVLTIASDVEPLPADTVERLEKFTELVAIAVADAESREARALLTDEQAALRRVATLVARGAAATEVFEAVAKEVGMLLHADTTVVGRYDDDRSATAIGSWSAAGEGVPVGTRSTIGGHNVLTLVAETGEPARVDGYDDASGEAAEIARRFGWRSSIAAAIVVEDRVWGVMLVATQGLEPFPVGAEQRLAQFTDLIATAVANTQSTDEVRRFGEEQAALGRVATLVAAGAVPQQVFTAVVSEASSLVGLDRIELVRYGEDNTATVIAASGEHPFPAGSTWSLDGPSVMAMVARTKRAARIEDYSNLEGEIARTARNAGFQSAIGAPITVEGRLWGVIIAISTDPEPIPEPAESRLGKFTELVATAVANAEARHELERVAAEQAALRRVATLVARGARPSDLFAAVAEEVGLLHEADYAYLTRIDSEDAVTAMARWDKTGESSPVPLPRRFAAGPMTAAIRTGRGPQRIDPYSDAAAGAFELGIRSLVAAPITVEGELWGMIGVSSKDAERPPAPGTEERLTNFTELVATAVANADARDDLHEMAIEQAALRRVATLVAGAVPASVLFEAVALEVSKLFGAAFAGVARFEGDSVLVVGESVAGTFPPRASLNDGGPSASAEVFRTGRPARVDGVDWSQVGGPLGEASRRLGVVSTVACPIVVEGRAWGALTLTSSDGVLPHDTEERLEKFSGLVATAIANADSRERIQRLADEQASLRRVATLVAEGVPAREFFSGVTTEVAHVFSDVDPSLVASVIRYDPGPESVLVGASRAYENEPIGSRWTPKELYVSTRVLRTGRAARVDAADLDAIGGPDANALRRRGFLYQVGSPVLVEGRIWGAMCLNSREALPADTDHRLGRFVELIATAIANAENRSELAASRKRLVAASDEARRRIERDLHDGIQQRLVSLALVARAAEAELPAGDGVREKLSTMATGLGEAVVDLQELSRGIHPAVLSDAGLGPALETLALRSPIPVEIDVRTKERFAEPVEVAAYFVVSESLANAAKHSQASRIDVRLARENERLVLGIRDDGVGGADPSRGSGLIGLRDRVEALGGRISIESDKGAGTFVNAWLLLADERSLAD